MTPEPVGKTYFFQPVPQFNPQAGNLPESEPVSVDAGPIVQDSDRIGHPMNRGGSIARLTVCCSPNLQINVTQLSRYRTKLTL